MRLKSNSPEHSVTAYGPNEAAFEAGVDPLYFERIKKDLPAINCPSKTSRETVLSSPSSVASSFHFLTLTHAHSLCFHLCRYHV